MNMFPFAFGFIRWPAVVGMVLLGMIAVGACGSDAETTPNGMPADTVLDDTRSVAVEVFEVQPTSFEDVIQLTGTIEAPDDATLSAEAAGTVRALVPLGGTVSRGQTVAQIDPGLAQASMRQAEATLAAARAQLELSEDQFRRQEPLYRDSIISALEFESIRAQRASARAQVAQAEAGVAQAREQLSRTGVVAPFSGRVEEHLVERGEQVSPGTPVVRVVATNNVKVTAGVPERYAADISLGAAVVVSPQAYGLPPQRGQISFVGQTINPQNRTFPVEVMLSNQAAQLKPQMVVRMDITRRSIEDALAVPLASVIRDEDGATVFVVVREAGRSIVRSRRVTLGSSTAGNVVVEQGLEPGDLVVTRGQTTVADGDPVRITDRRTLVSNVATD
jgi:membrane fusion protein, multidrug efflux system